MAAISPVNSNKVFIVTFITSNPSDDLRVMLYETRDEVEPLQDMLPETAKHLLLLTSISLILGRPMDIQNKCSKLQHLQINVKGFSNRFIDMYVCTNHVVCICTHADHNCSNLRKL